MKSKADGISRRGRPRGFDLERALDRALEVFWRKGYEGASLPELTEAMSINRPSLYAAFGNKESLFRKALDRYCSGPANYVNEALKAPTARQVVERLFDGSIAGAMSRNHPRGCLLVQGALTCGEGAEEVRAELAQRRAAGFKALAKRFEFAQTEGDLPASIDAEGLARFYMTVLHGMAVQSASGGTAAELRGVADNALRAWPQRLTTDTDVLERRAVPGPKSGGGPPGSH